MYPINNELPKSAADVSKNNVPSPYLPIVTNRRNLFSWGSVQGLVLSDVLGKQLGNYTLDQYREDCRQTFISKLDEESFWSIIDDMYFSREEIKNVTPEFSLFEATKSLTATAERIATAFSGLLHGYEVGRQQKYSLSYLERLMYETFVDHLEFKKQHKVNRLTSYLPFLSHQFQEDLNFLLRHPGFLNEAFLHFLKLYAFLYITQLALNAGAWKDGEPKAKPLYYITDTEKASGERRYVMHYGFRYLQHALERLFPILSLTEVLQPHDGKTRKQGPLWMLAKEITGSPDRERLVSDLSAYANAFKEERNLKTAIKESGDPLDWIETLVTMALDQFSPGRSRFKPNMDVVQDIQEKLCEGFIQVRGRAGKTLVMSQDYVVLLTNLTIGDNERLRLHELLEGYRARGVFFDKISEQVLVEFFERIGNVDRMSDSGDAVYVRKTI